MILYMIQLWEHSVVYTNNAAFRVFGCLERVGISISLLRQYDGLQVTKS
jgi:hypothetical protein